MLICNIQTKEFLPYFSKRLYKAIITRQLIQDMQQLAVLRFSQRLANYYLAILSLVRHSTELRVS